ncbi:MAG: hypothetical protein J4428_03845 [Candidatus Aenigmarchaeota archaeon]|nr:hypothetical protein [Candidatus Aenigmarchaeota archaeon]
MSLELTEEMLLSMKPDDLKSVLVIYAYGMTCPQTTIDRLREYGIGDVYAFEIIHNYYLAILGSAFPRAREAILEAYKEGYDKIKKQMVSIVEYEPIKPHMIIRHILLQ